MQLHPLTPSSIIWLIRLSSSMTLRSDEPVGADEGYGAAALPSHIKINAGGSERSFRTTAFSRVV